MTLPYSVCCCKRPFTAHDSATTESFCFFVLYHTIVKSVHKNS